jgi:hypothetical protein
MGKPLEARSSRDLITNAGKYGLTTGSYQAENLALTEAAKAIVGETRNRQAEFEQAIAGIAPFKSLYERLRGKRVPALDVLEQQVTGVPNDNRRECATFFLRNARYIGLVYSYQGADHLRSIEETCEELDDQQTEEAVTPAQEPVIQPPAAAPKVQLPPRQPDLPTMHIDINIHIDSDASPEVIDQFFASMARHIYNRE